MGLTVGFDATAAVRQTAGIGRYTRQLLDALAARPDDISYHLFSCKRADDAGSLPPLDARFRHRSIPASDRTLNAVWHRFRLPIPVQLFAGRFDVFHSPDFTLPPAGGKPSLLTIHDLAFLRTPEAAYPTLRDYLERAVPASARRATRIIAVSECTRLDLIELLDISPDRITTILEGVGKEFHPPYDRSHAERTIAELRLRTPYLLSVATLEPRKNYLRLLEAYALLRRRGVEHRLVIAGRPGWLYEPILRRVSELGLDGHVAFVRPGDRQLVALYGLADVFVYPSLYEGFGIPPLEALACGVPVACSNTSSLPEVVDNAALMFDPYDIEAIASAIESLLGNDMLRAELVAAGVRRAAELTWERTASATVRLYQELAANGS